MEMTKIALVGATGLVGSIMMKVLEERGFGGSEFLPCASAKSVGKEVRFAGKPYKILPVEEAIEAAPDIAIFSANDELVVNDVLIVDTSFPLRFIIN